MSESFKICIQCRKLKPRSQFPSKYDGTTRRRSRCRDCYNEWQSAKARARYAKGKGKAV